MPSDVRGLTFAELPKCFGRLEATSLGRSSIGRDREIFDDFLSPSNVTIGAVDEVYEARFWVARNNVSKNETGESLESLKSVLSVFE
jgi:hypothetical protein